MRNYEKNEVEEDEYGEVYEDDNEDDGVHGQFNEKDEVEEGGQ